MNRRLRPEQRMRSPKSFQTVVRKGRFARGGFLNLWVLDSDETTPQERPIWGIVVSRKVDTHATRRNVWKRRIREVLRLNQSRIRPDVAMVIQARGRGEAPPQTEIEMELKKLCRKLGAWRSRA